MMKIAAIISMWLCTMNLCAQVIIQKGSGVIIQNGVEVVVGSDFINEDEIQNDGTLRLTGNWENKNKNGGLIDSKGEVVLIGGNQELKGDYPMSFPSLKLSGTGIKVVSQNVRIFNLLDLSDRELSLIGRKLTLSNASESSLNRSSGFISSTEGGFFYRKLGQSGNYLYPMGANDNGQFLYRPIEINSPSNEGNTVGISFLKKDPNTAYYYRESRKDNISDVNFKFYHVIDRTDGDSRMKVNYFYNNEDGYASLAKWKDSFWENLSLNKSLDLTSPDLNKQFIFEIDDSFKTVPIALASVKDAHNLVFYNSYSPDGDGKNDTWTIGNIDGYPENEITIFNRWGGEVFKTKSFSSLNRWDGSSLNDGTYYYLLKVKIGDEYRVFKGFISLVKNQK
ncbi:hypothetical protein Pedsa_0179 [Pseudopedobacter saltans DSM 12145]|uniref:Gliding motility-associated C-terminal domain-containing protein n=1 Tax=Pseudopedobacter saltans (strain ATCC 51119 / DSM 12145 / JCM 21818 / CCUG 39354 / LMG 10337 / NBRC 100064 / NCIMB 13643) TaxID=762903 RepID=F0SDN8_PSESL|nr:gliding motility-associated C-terminal domain-containing protein [Pseudopedobacter saltans]ADY50765.1 hypothetical protein Pedsa_0179 [Pseudopedobacter saltans DSM 12145]